MKISRSAGQILPVVSAGSTFRLIAFLSEIGILSANYRLPAGGYSGRGIGARRHLRNQSQEALILHHYVGVEAQDDGERFEEKMFTVRCHGKGAAKKHEQRQWKVARILDLGCRMQHPRGTGGLRAPPDPARLRDIERICEQAAKERPRRTE